jgi:hypothetical protein
VLKHRLLVLVGYNVFQPCSHPESRLASASFDPVTFTFIPWHGSKLLYVICSLTVIAKPSATQPSAYFNTFTTYITPFSLQLLSSSVSPLSPTTLFTPH